MDRSVVITLGLIAVALLVGAVVQFGPAVLTFLAQGEVNDAVAGLEREAYCNSILVDLRILDGRAVATNQGERDVNGTLRTLANGSVLDSRDLSLEPGRSAGLRMDDATNASFTIPACDRVVTLPG